MKRYLISFDDVAMNFLEEEIAAACRCAQEVREVSYDPES